RTLCLPRRCTEARNAHLPVRDLELPLLPVLTRPHGPADTVPPIAARPWLVSAPTPGNDLHPVRRIPALFASADPGLRAPRPHRPDRLELHHLLRHPGLPVLL